MYYIDIHILSQILNDWARPKTQSHHQDQYFQTGLGWHLPTAMKIHTPGKNWTETLNDHIISTWNSECFVVHQTTESRFIKSLHSLHHLHHWPKGFICSHGLIHQKLWRWKQKIEVSNTVLWVNMSTRSANLQIRNIWIWTLNIRTSFETWFDACHRRGDKVTSPSEGGGLLPTSLWKLTVKWCRKSWPYLKFQNMSKTLGIWND